MSSGKNFTPNNGGNQQQRTAGNGAYNAYNSNSYTPNNGGYYYAQQPYGYAQPVFMNPYSNNNGMYSNELAQGGARMGGPAATPAAAKPAVSKPAEDVETAKKREEFRNQLLEKARAKKEALEAKKKAETAESEVAKSASVQESKKEEEPVNAEEVPKVEEPVKATVVEEEAPKVEEPVKAAEPELEAPKQAEAEEPKQESEPKTEEEPTAAPAAIVTEAPKSAEEPKPLESKYAYLSEQKIEEPAFSTNVPNYADLVPKFAELKIVENPFEFEYPESFTKPDPKLLEKGPKLRYDPMFLNQFNNVKFDAGEEFKNRLLFVVKSIHERSAPKNNSGRGGFGQGSIGGGYNKSNQNLRRLDSRSNSRQGSKRKPQNNRSERKSNRRGPSDRHHSDEKEKEPEVPAEPVKPLEKSANRWIPKSRLAKTEEVKYAPDGVTVILSADDVKRKVKSQLNKLTLEFFDTITDEIIKIAEQSKWEEDAQTLKTVIDLIFDKAVDEPHWSAMYAQFCAKIFKSISDEVKDVTSLDKDNKPLTGGFLFRKYLLTKCQIEYEKGWVDKLPTNEDGTAIEPELMSEEYYQIATAKRRGLGLVKFFGQLYVLNLLGENIIFICLQAQSKNIDDPSDDTVENLIQLVKTVGPRLDHSSPISKNKFDQVLARIATLSKNEKIPSRLQFSLMDVLDSRKSNWAGNEEAGPKTISQIHQEESRKQQEDQREKLEKRRQKGNDSRQNSGRGQWTNNRVSESDFQRAGQVSTPSQSSGPTNNFQRAKSSRGVNNRLGNNNSNNSSNNKTQNSSPLANVSSSANLQGLGSRENSKRPLNAFSALGDESEESETEEEEQAQEDEEDNSTINEDSSKEQGSAETAETSTSEEVTKE